MDDRKVFECPDCGSLYAQAGFCDRDGMRLEATNELSEALEISEPVTIEDDEL
jgi:hypothetical protein